MHSTRGKYTTQLGGSRNGSRGVEQVGVKRHLLINIFYRERGNF